jgi:hypothetical protein
MTEVATIFVPLTIPRLSVLALIISTQLTAAALTADPAYTGRQAGPVSHILPGTVTEEDVKK